MLSVAARTADTGLFIITRPSSITITNCTRSMLISGAPALGTGTIFRFRCVGNHALLRVMNVNLGIWDKLSRLVVCLLLLAAGLGVALAYWPLIQKNENFRKKMYELDERIKKEKATAKQQQVSIDAIRTDPKTVERLAREKLGYAKPGETIIRFEPAPTNISR